MRAQDRASAVNIGSKGEVLRSFALKAFGINAIALSMVLLNLLAFLMTSVEPTAAAEGSAGPFSDRVRGDGSPVDGTWGWFATPVSKHVIVCWVFRDLLCTTRPGFDELHVLPNSRGPHQIDWYKKRPRFTKPMLLAPRLQVGTWIKNDLGYACYLEKEKLTCKNSHGYGFYISTVDGRAYYFDPPRGTHLNKDFAYFGEGVRVDEPLNAFAGGGDEGAGSYRYFCRLLSNVTLLCWRSSPWLSIILQSKGRPVLRESELGDSSGKMFVPLLDASKWWRHRSDFACAMRGETFETSDLICENSTRHGFRLSQTQVELF